MAAVSVVGSSPVAKHVYATAAASEKRVQALGGAKNALVVMPDADLNATVESIVTSAFGCAGQRCLAGSNVFAVGDIAEPLAKSLLRGGRPAQARAGHRSVDEDGTGDHRPGQGSRARVTSMPACKRGPGCDSTARETASPACPDGYFVGPTIFDEVVPEMTIARDEIFGPVVTILRVKNLDEAIERVNASPFGNSASLYTTSGGAARVFRKRIEAGMLGHQPGRAGADGLLPVQRLEGLVLRRPARPGQGRDRFLHPPQSRHVALGRQRPPLEIGPLELIFLVTIDRHAALMQGPKHVRNIDPRALGPPFWPRTWERSGA